MATRKRIQMQPEAIAAWVAEYKSGSNGAFQLNIWVREPQPIRDAENEARLRDFLSGWGAACTS